MVFRVLSENNVHLMSKNPAGGHMSGIHVHSTVSLDLKIVFIYFLSRHRNTILYPV